MKIGILSDTHDQIENLLWAIDMLNRQNIGLLIHCGDWVAPFTLKYYQQLKCPIKGVFGNNDGDKFRHLQVAKRLDLSIIFEDRFLSLEIDSRRLAVWHGDYPEITDALVQCGKYDAVFHGHTHISVNEKHGNTLSLNPGSLMAVTAESVSGISFAIYDTATNSAQLIRK